MNNLKNTDSKNRFLIALVDYLISRAVIVIIYSIIWGILSKESQNMNGITPSYYLIFTAFGFGLFGFIFLYLIVLSVYYIFIPLYSKKQTIGRNIFKSRLVMENNEELKLADYALREIMGNLIFLILNGICAAGLIIQLLLLSRIPVSTIQDKISGTKMVDYSNNNIYDDINHNDR